MQRAVQNHVRDCDICRRHKIENVHSPELLQPLAIPKAAFAKVTMDFITGLPLFEGKEVIMVVMDRLTKYSHFIGLSHPITTPQVARAYVDNVIKLYGLPRSIISNRIQFSSINFGRSYFIHKEWH